MDKDQGVRLIGTPWNEFTRSASLHTTNRRILRPFATLGNQESAPKDQNQSYARFLGDRKKCSTNEPRRLSIAENSTVVHPTCNVFTHRSSGLSAVFVVSYSKLSGFSTLRHFYTSLPNSHLYQGLH